MPARVGVRESNIGLVERYRAGLGESGGARLVCIGSARSCNAIGGMM